MKTASVDMAEAVLCSSCENIENVLKISEDICIL